MARQALPPNAPTDAKQQNERDRYQAAADSSSQTRLHQSSAGFFCISRNSTSLHPRPSPTSYARQRVARRLYKSLSANRLSSSFRNARSATFSICDRRQDFHSGDALSFLRPGKRRRSTVYLTVAPTVWTLTSRTNTEADILRRQKPFCPPYCDTECPRRIWDTGFSYIC